MTLHELEADLAELQASLERLRDRLAMRRQAEQEEFTCDLLRPAQTRHVFKTFSSSPTNDRKAS